MSKDYEPSYAPSWPPPPAGQETTFAEELSPNDREKGGYLGGHGLGCLKLGGF